jgi:uncharacterized repeat protein (TIGR03803 family)
MPTGRVRSRCLCAFTITLLIIAAARVGAAQTYTDLLNFDGKHGYSAVYPQILAQGRDGNLYGTAPLFYGGGGVVFSLSLDGAVKILHYFDGSDGERPYSGLILGRDGNFYGTTFEGGSNGLGTIFRITPKGSLTTVYNFAVADGQSEALPVQANEGDFYGTTTRTAYKVSQSGAFTSLASLWSGEAVGSFSLLQATDGNFYGTATGGGASNEGFMFKMTPQGNMTILYNFNAHVPAFTAQLVQASDGNFYGTTFQGGSYKAGVVFELTPQGAISDLHDFDPNSADGSSPDAGLVQASDGNFYGVTGSGGSMNCGVIFEIAAGGEYSILFDFDSTQGCGPGSTQTQHTNGKIYGLTAVGGTHNLGVAYSFDLGLPPFVRLLPALGKVGATVEMLGQGFTGTSAVSFNGIAAAFNVVSDTYLTATVPSGATTGGVSVATPAGVLNSDQSFHVFQ